MIYIQVPTAKFRTWSQRMIFEGGFYHRCTWYELQDIQLIPNDWVGSLPRITCFCVPDDSMISQIYCRIMWRVGVCLLPSRITCFAFGSSLIRWYLYFPPPTSQHPPPHLPPPTTHSVLFVVVYVYERLGRGFVHHTQRASWSEQSCTCLYM